MLSPLNEPEVLVPPVYETIRSAYVTFDLCSSSHSVTQLRKTMRCFVESIHGAAEDQDDLEAIVGELASNVVCHAPGIGYVVSVEFVDDLVTLTVIDAGRGFALDPLSCSGSFDTASRMGDREERFGGWGWPIVFSLADDLDIQPNVPQGTIVRATKRLRVRPAFPN